ncbi:MAG: DNA repair protein RecN [Deltaproteobacteria bacterium]|nr:DNA repair protein RecN [Deltaproteobacteria bacterium]
MLSRLRITDFVLIDALDLSFEPGFTAVTGETGAGKSILVEALSLLAGGRASSDLVRSGAAEAVVEAVFEVDGEEIAVRRTLQADGRSKVMLNGALATVAMLGSTLGSQISIAGQHEHQRLLSEACQLDWLDRFAGPASALIEVARAHELVVAARAELERIRGLAGSRDERAAWLRHVAAEIGEAALRLCEDEELAEERVRAKHGAELAAVVAHALDTLYAGEGAVVGRLHVAGTALERTARIDGKFGDWAARLAEAKAEVEVVAAEVRDFAERLDVEPLALDAIEARLDRIEKLERKYGGSIASALAAADNARAEVATLEDLDTSLAEATRAVEAAERMHHDVCAGLSRARRRAAKALSRRVTLGLAEVGMAAATFDVAVSPVEPPGPRGAESVSFVLSANRGEPTQPLLRVASGGELSRVHLALCEALAERAPANCTLFDEIDAGLGGAAAEAVGRKLRIAGARGQVIAITHHAQIAALADHHVTVSKREAAGRTVTDVQPLDNAERAGEIARMLAGEKISEHAMAHARSMIAGARVGRKRVARAG